MIAFSVFLVSGDDEDNCDNIWNIFRYQKLGTNSSLPVILAGWPYPNRDENDENSFRDRCLKDQAEFFYQNYILSGGVKIIFIFIASFFAYNFGNVLKKVFFCDFVYLGFCGFDWTLVHICLAMCQVLMGVHSFPILGWDLSK